MIKYIYMSDKSFFKFALAFGAIIAVGIMSLAVTGYIHKQNTDMSASVIEKK